MQQKFFYQYRKNFLFSLPSLHDDGKSHKRKQLEREFSVADIGKCYLGGNAVWFEKVFKGSSDISLASCPFSHVLH